MAIESRANICDLDALYQRGVYEYSLPRKVLESFLDGKAFDHKESYTATEKTALLRDIENIYNKQTTRKELPIAVISAGAPGAGKTRLMRQDQEHLRSSGEIGYSYIDPDDVCLKEMEETYQVELREKLAAIEHMGFTEEADRIAAEKAIRLELYNKWRPGSNAANHIILAHLIKHQFAFYFGTTATSPQTHLFFKFLKDHGYQIRLMHLSATDDVRWASVQERDKTFVQTTEADIREKGDLFPRRISDTYLKYADEIGFYHRAAVDQAAVLGATWVRIDQTKNGRLTILNQNAYEQIKTIHNLNESDEDSWENTVEGRSELAPRPTPAVPEARYCACLENILPSWLLGAFESVAVCIASLVQSIRGLFVTSNA